MHPSAVPRRTPHGTRPSLVSRRQAVVRQPGAVATGLARPAASLQETPGPTTRVAFPVVFPLVPARPGLSPALSFEQWMGGVGLRSP